MFTEWLLDQQEREDSVGKLARVVRDDHNAGCATMFRDPVSWKEHFEHYHRKSFAALFTMLGDAYVEYATSLNTKTDRF